MRILFAVFFLLASSAAIAQEETVSIEPTACHSGDWFTPSSEGEGYNLNVLPNGNATFYFYTYLSSSGIPVFYTSLLERTENNCLQGDFIYSFGGDIFGDDNPQEVQREPTGTRVTICLASDDLGVALFEVLDDPDTAEDESQNFLLREFARLTPKHEELCND